MIPAFQLVQLPSHAALCKFDPVPVIFLILFFFKIFIRILFVMLCINILNQLDQNKLSSRGFVEQIQI